MPGPEPTPIAERLASPALHQYVDASDGVSLAGAGGATAGPGAAEPVLLLPPCRTSMEPGKLKGQNADGSEQSRPMTMQMASEPYSTVSIGGSPIWAMTDAIGALTMVAGSIGAVQLDGETPSVVHDSGVHSPGVAAAYMLPQELHTQIWVFCGNVYPMPE